ncbi:hypothetical protein ElyMa_005996300 [Elysia marginata]|uniref:Uncharacterized protein n=1 Tax=Elysia marginata TaxID=1093978 RepID=A0AAV4GGW1_9GAST|nr:hypothetical protein ElyMa_005996300 [Elysia marginata]
MGNKLRKFKESIMNPESQSGLDTSAEATAQEGRYTPLGDSSSPNSVTEGGKTTTTSGTPANGGATGVGDGGGGGEGGTEGTGLVSSPDSAESPHSGKSPAPQTDSAPDSANQKQQLSATAEDQAKGDTGTLGVSSTGADPALSPSEGVASSDSASLQPNGTSDNAEVGVFSFLTNCFQIEQYICPERRL